MGFSSTFEFTAGAVPADHQSADAYDAQVQGQSGGSPMAIDLV
jgi:hypothetical protein